MRQLYSGIDKKFFGDTAWNYLAFSVMALTGILLNFLIAWKSGIESLGVFNQIYAVYVILGQLAVFGINDSVQKNTAEHNNDINLVHLIGSSALYLSLLFGVSLSILLFLLSEIIASIIESNQVGLGLKIVAPAIALFAINKVMMGVLNGLRKIRAFSIAQIIRLVVILTTCCFIIFDGRPAYQLAIGFLMAEILLAPILLVITKTWKWPFNENESLTWITNHLKFGVKALSGGFLSESYLRIDILMLAIFVGDKEIGVYSFAAMFIEGLFQLSVVIRTVANPILVQLVIQKNISLVINFVRKVAPLSMAIYLIVACAIWFCFPFLEIIYPNTLIVESREIILILSIGLLIYSAFIPVEYVFLQSGMPGKQSILFLINITFNLILNLALIPFLGIKGAAIATAISFVLSALNVNICSKLWLGYSKGLLFKP